MFRTKHLKTHICKNIYLSYNVPLDEYYSPTFLSLLMLFVYVAACKDTFTLTTLVQQ